MEDYRQHTFEQRVTYLEGRLDSHERAVPKRLSIWVGLLALTVAISTGAFQLYDGLFLRKQAEFEENRRELSEYIRRITELNSYIIRLQGQMISLGKPYNPAAAWEVKTLNIEKHSIIQLADLLIEQHEEVGSYAAFFVLAQEHLTFGNNAMALDYSHKAESVSHSNAEATEAGRYIAHALFAPGERQNKTAAREKFKKVLHLANNNKTYFRSDLLAQIYKDWISMEINFGECSAATHLLSQMADELKTLPNGSKVYISALEELKTTLGNVSNCSSLIAKLKSPSVYSLP